MTTTTTPATIPRTCLPYYGVTRLSILMECCDRFDPSKAKKPIGFKKPSDLAV